jgi:hypothetical protein
MGGVLLMIALRNAGIGRDRSWLLGGVLVWATVAVVFANVADPEAFIVRHNVARASAGATLDPDYLSALSDDAAPALARAIDHARAGVDVAALREALRCGDDVTGAASMNLAVARAADVRRRECP